MTTHPGPKLYGIKVFTTKCAWDRCSRKELETGNVFNLLWGKKKLGLVDAYNPRSLRG